MRIPDVNVLVYSCDPASAHSAAARGWIERALSSNDTVGFAIVAVLGFVRVITNPRVFRDPLAPAEAFDQVDEWLAQPPAMIIGPSSRHLGICRELLETSGTAGNLTTDAHLAALAIERGAMLASFDGDFHRFGGLQLEYLH